MCPTCFTTVAVLATGATSAMGLGTLLMTMVAKPRRPSGSDGPESGAPAKGERHGASESRIED
jgi:hypothetical protein